MHPLRRLAAIVLNGLLIQVSLVGYGATCAPDGTAMSSASGAMMTMTHIPARLERACVEPDAGDACPVPCPSPACVTMTGCLAVALPVRTDVLAADAPMPDHAWRDPALARQAPRPAPDLPPPRA